MTEWVTRSPLTGEEFVYARTWALQERNVQNCRILSQRHDLLALLPAQAVVAMLDLHDGELVRSVVDVCRPAELHLLGASDGQFAAATEGAPTESVRYHAGPPIESLRQFADGSLDLIFLPDSVTYDDVSAELAVAADKIRPDGLTVVSRFTGYSHLEHRQYGILRAVIDACCAGRFEFVYFALDLLGFHDVALRKLVDVS